MKNHGLEGIHHNSIWPDGPELEPVPDSFESIMDSAQNLLRRKIEELIRAREKRTKKIEDTGEAKTEKPTHNR